MLDDVQDDSQDALKAGIAAAIRDDGMAARLHLWRAVSSAPQELLAWQWLAKVAENRDEQEMALARVEALRGESEAPPRRLGRLRSEERGRPRARGKCQLCGLPWADPPQRCARCRAVLDLAEPAAFFVPIDVDVPLLRAAIERWSEPPQTDEATRHRVLALARLNLGELAEALAHGRVVADLEPDDEVVARLCRALSELLSSMPAESGFETDVFDRPTPDELDSID